MALWYPFCGGIVPPVDCINCNTGTTPTAVQVVIPALGNGTCTNCDSIAGTYVLPCVGPCTYVRDVTLSLGVCGSVTFRIQAATGQNGGAEARYVTVTNLTNGQYTMWYYYGGYGLPYDCSGVKTLQLGGYSSGQCNHNAAGTTVEWTSLY